MVHWLQLIIAIPHTALPHATLHHCVGFTESVKLILLLPDVCPLDDDEDEAANPEEDTDPSSGQCSLYQPVLENGLCPRIVGIEVVLIPVPIVVIEVLYMVVMQLLMVIGVGEDCPAGHPHCVQVLAKWVPHFACVAPELVVIVKPLNERVKHPGQYRNKTKNFVLRQFDYLEIAK